MTTGPRDAPAAAGAAAAAATGVETAAGAAVRVADGVVVGSAAVADARSVAALLGAATVAVGVVDPSLAEEAEEPSALRAAFVRVGDALDADAVVSTPEPAPCSAAAAFETSPVSV
ncbi:hypothetical protein [Kytococcus sp. HMSC28H12]|uniref:hypothetical protein n=1 Tax=Kytococcus sp. HMSC28H12 TaxID=1581067 RepID=UPI00143A6053|nr:hypothetical protein [Kytococcus sp. HMSC28H12]